MAEKIKTRLRYKTFPPTKEGTIYATVSISTWLDLLAEGVRPVKHSEHGPLYIAIKLAVQNKG